MVNVDAPPTVTAALCRCQCVPRVALKVGALREALAFMGHTGGEGGEVRFLGCAFFPLELGAAPVAKRQCDWEVGAITRSLGPLQLVELVPGGSNAVAPGGTPSGAGAQLAMYFSQSELQELLQFERAASVLQMRNEEVARRGGQPGTVAATH